MRISVVSMVMECLIVSKRGVRGYEVNNCRVRVCEALDSEVHGREVMARKRLIIKCTARIIFKYCFRTAIEAIPIGFLRAMAVVEEIGPWRLFEKLASGVGWDGMEG